MRVLRERIAVVSASVSRSLRPELPALDVVLTGRHAALETWWHEYTDDDRDRGPGPAGRRRLRWRRLRRATVRAAVRRRAPAGAVGPGAHGRARAPADGRTGRRPGPRGPGAAAGRLAALAADPSVPPLVLVTHHVEEIPPGVTHAALLRAGRMVAAGPIDEVLTGGAVSRRSEWTSGRPPTVDGRPGPHRGCVTRRVARREQPRPTGVALGERVGRGRTHVRGAIRRPGRGRSPTSGSTRCVRGRGSRRAGSSTPPRCDPSRSAGT